MGAPYYSLTPSVLAQRSPLLHALSSLPDRGSGRRRRTPERPATLLQLLEAPGSAGPTDGPLLLSGGRRRGGGCFRRPLGRGDD